MQNIKKLWEEVWQKVKKKADAIAKEVYGSGEIIVASTE